MKTLYLVRHAKSSWKYREKRDVERPLKDRGKSNAFLMAQHLVKLGDKPDYFLSSPAERAKETAFIFLDVFNVNEDELHFNQSVYEASVAELFTLSLSLPENKNSAMIFGHEPSLSSFTQTLTDKYLEKFPTSGVAKIQFNVELWNEIAAGSGKLVYFIFPGMFTK